MATNRGAAYKQRICTEVGSTVDSAISRRPGHLRPVTAPDGQRFGRRGDWRRAGRCNARCRLPTARSRMGQQAVR